MSTAKPGKRTSKNTNPTVDQRIKAQGVVQAVIASQAPVEDWERLSRYGLRLVNAFAATMAGNKVKFPPLPYERDPSAVCMGDDDIPF